MPETPARPYSRSFAAALRGFIRERGFRQKDLAERLEKSPGYVSEHLSGLRAVDTDMLDAVAELAGTDTRHVLLEVARRMENAEQTAAESAGRIVSEARALAAEQRDLSDEERKPDTPKRTGSP